MANSRNQKRVIQIIEASSDLMTILKIIDQLNLPQAVLAAGSIRNTVWQFLSHQPLKLISDVDVVFFDPNEAQIDDQEIQTYLNQCFPKYCWQVKNQVYMHHYDSQTARPFTSVTDAISHFVETPTCVGAYLKDNQIELIAPYGVDDLLALKCQLIPIFQQDKAHLAIYRQRVLKKQWQKRWPKLTIQNL